MRAAVRPAVQRARDAETDRARARRIADEAARLRGDAESRAVRELEDALDGSGIKNKTFLEKAWDVISTPFRSWDDFVSFAGKVAMVAGLVVLVIGTGGLAGAILAGVAVAAGAVVLADALNKYRQGRGSLGQVALAAVGVLPFGKGAGLLAQSVKALSRLRGAAALVRGGGGRALGLGALRAGLGGTATSIRSAINAGGTRAGAAANAAWQRGRQFFSKDPVHFPTGIVLLPQTDVDLPGVLPLRLERTHLSAHRTGRWFGRSWASTLDQRVEVDDEGVCLVTETGVLLAFPHPSPDGGEPALPADGPRLELRADGDAYTVTDPLTGRTTHFAGPGEVRPVSAVTDRNGNRIDFHYTPDGLLTDVTHSGGYHLDVETRQGRVVEIRLRGAGQTLLTYGYDDDTGDLTEVVNSSGLPLRFSYDEEGRMTRWLDRIGTWYAYTYDEEGRCVSGTGAGGVFATEIGYGDGVTTARDSLGHTTTYHYNDLLQVTRETDPLGHATHYRWDPFDRLLARTDPLGATTEFGYDDAGALLSVVRPDGAVRRVTRTPLHLPETVTDHDGTTTTFTYDDRGNPLSDGTTTCSYDERGALTSITDALGHTHALRNDPAGLPVAITDPLGGTTRHDRDPFGRVTATTDPLGNTTRHTWTVEGRPATRTLPGGATEHRRYDAENNLIEHVDALGQVTRTEIGPFDQPAARTTPDGARLEFAYDTELRLLAVTDPQGLTWRYTYDAAGGLTEESDFDQRVITYARDPAGRVTERVNGAGQSTTYVHDVLGQVVARHSGGQATTFAYDELGRLVRAANADAVLTFARDAAGRVTAETCNGRAVTSAYDAAGRRTARRTPSGARTAWAYDACGQPASVRTGGQTIRFGYDPAGREISRDFGADVTLTSHWSADSRLDSQILTAGPAQRVVQSRRYGYRADGHVTEIDDLLAGPRRFDLDPVGRVTGVLGPGWSERYAYNVAGQVTDALWPAPADSRGPRAYTGTLIRQAGRTHYAYDRQGRLVLRRQKGLSAKPRTWHYTWDADDRLTSVTTPDGTRWRYLYDPLGRRIAKEHADGTHRTDFVWDGLTLAEQSTGDRTTSWDWQPGTFHPLAQTDRHHDQDRYDERFHAITTDLIGTPTALVAPDGTLTWRPRPHTLWGAGPADTDCPLRFPGQYADPESGLHYNFFRYYDPESARYLSDDPLGLLGGSDPGAYVVNPYSWCDPFGLSPYRPQGASRPYVNPRGNWTNDLYTVDRQKMLKHLDGTPGESQFLFHVEAEKLALDAAAFADANNLWVLNKARVLVTNGPIGVHARTGHLTDWITVTRSGKKIHAWPMLPSSVP
ncbi:DUF6531 domain-containing protein [Actinomadura sp. ATCC 31491]|uniref:DUF6531 domain-containing protein n=1 Tax=Actinomadura luzonensis TaxID=2805427 RepID=A0ABT0FSE8_9ACTN|nr:DUF6531 domain-containing protein [Actinomadura luzonensis]MCK2214920.1 DUF6531 domain-containing protein [Actinomadura luzonensis]